jgi:hypothetical protein
MAPIDGNSRKEAAQHGAPSMPREEEGRRRVTATVPSSVAAVVGQVARGE